MVSLSLQNAETTLGTHLHLLGSVVIQILYAHVEILTLAGWYSGWGQRPRTLLGGSSWGRRLRALLGGGVGGGRLRTLLGGGGRRLRTLLDGGGWGSKAENPAGWWWWSTSENPAGWYMNTLFSELVYLLKKKMEKDHINVEGLINISKNRKK